MSLYSVLVTGANRGIGFEFIQQLASIEPKISHLIAACRNPDQATELNEFAKKHDNLTVLKLDVINYGSYDEFFDQVSSIVGDKGLNMLINNAGICIETEFEDVTRDEMMANFEVDGVAPLLLSQKLLPLLKLSGSQNKARTLIVNVSSKVGSISDNKLGGKCCGYPCRVSKTAINQISKSMSVDLLKYGIHTMLIDPGFVMTDMGGPDALITKNESISGMLKVILDKDRDVNGKLITYKGVEIAW